MTRDVTTSILPLTRAQKAAATRAEKQRLEREAAARRFEEQQRARRAEEAIWEAESRHFLITRRTALLEIGLHAPNGSGRRTFANAGCVAVILGLIAKGCNRRGDILQTMRHEYRYSYRHTGFLLSRMCGTDTEQHLWYVDADHSYRLHEASRTELVAV